MACKRPIAVSVECEDGGGDICEERSADLCFFLCGAGPEPSWSNIVKNQWTVSFIITNQETETMIKK